MRVQPAIAASTVVIGVDLAKRSLVAMALHGDGRRTKPRKFKNELEGFEGLLAFCEESAADSGGFVVAFEPTGHYGEPLVQWLMDEGVALYRCSRFTRSGRRSCSMARVARRTPRTLW